MDKEEFRIKLEEINRLVEMKDYKGALEIVDSIDWRRVKNVRTLCVVGEIYAANKRYEDSRDIFLLAYHRSSLGKNILGRLIDISIKLGDFDEAQEYYDEYRNIAPNDNTLYVLNYKILKGKNAPIQEQITALETYKKKEFTEKWSYELAKLYYQAGDKEKCKNVCDEMILWFSDGLYVMKALDLKMRMGIITEEEKKKLDKAFVPKLYTQDELRQLKEKQKKENNASAPETDAEESSGKEKSDEENFDNNNIDNESIDKDSSDKENSDKENSDKENFDKENSDKENFDNKENSDKKEFGEKDSAEEESVKDNFEEKDFGEEVKERDAETEEAPERPYKPEADLTDEDLSESDADTLEAELREAGTSSGSSPAKESSAYNFSPKSFSVQEAVSKGLSMQDSFRREPVMQSSLVEDDVHVPERVKSLSDDFESGTEKKRVKKYSLEDDDIPPLESSEDYYSDQNSYDEADDRDFPVIESIRVNNDKELGTVETLQERISKGIRELFGGRRKHREEPEEEIISEDQEEMESEDREMVSDLEKESEIPREKDQEFVDLADEDIDIEENTKEKRSVFPKTIKLPELKIPKSFRRSESNKNKEEDKITAGQKDAENVPDENQSELRKTKDLKQVPEKLRNKKAAGEEVKEEIKEELKGDFNLEDTILAAATAQGIEIPGEETENPDQEEMQEDPADSEEENTGAVFSKSHDEEITEEDLRRAEEEFMKGPSETEDSDVPDLEPDDIVNLDEVSLDEEDEEFLKKIPEEENGEDVSDVSYETKGISVLEDEDEDYEGKSKKEVKISDPENDSSDSDEAEKTPDKEDDLSVNEVQVQENPSDADSEEDSSTENAGTEEDNIKENPAKEEDLTEEEKLERFIESIHPEEKRDPFEIVIRDRELTEDEVKLFSYFVKVPGMKEQLLDALINVQKESVDNTSKSGNVIVMGGNESGKTRLISSLIPAICKELNLTAAKQAYVFAEQINGKNIDAIFEKLAGGFFVIENANQLDQATAEALNQAMEKETDGLIVILEDNKIGMRKLIARYPKLARKFTSLINIPVFTNDELAAFARVYALENGYKIDNMGMLALYNLIGENQKEDVPMNVGAVKKIIDAAIAKSKGGLRVFRKNADKKRIDKDGYILLFEKDFN